MTSFPPSLQTQAEDLSKNVVALTTLLQKETATLEKMNLGEFQSLQADKDALVEFCERQSQELKPYLSKHPDPSFRKKLRENFARLHRVAEQDFLAVAAVRETTEEFSQIVRNAIMEKSSATKTYGQKGQVQYSNPSPNLRPQRDS